MSTRQKARLLRTLLCATLCVALAIAAVVWFCSTPLRVRVFDPKFRVLSVRVLRNRNDQFYLGNQFEGRLRAFLRDRCHLNVKPLADVSVLPRDGSCTLALRYSFEVNPSASLSPDAELVDCSGTAMGVGGGYVFWANPYCETLNLDLVRTNAGDYTLKLKRAGVCVAEVEIKDLPPVLHKAVHIGTNAF